MMAAVNAGITNETAYQAIRQMVDVPNLIDYMMLHIFAEAEDWPHHNWYAAHRRATNGAGSHVRSYRFTPGGVWTSGRANGILAAEAARSDWKCFAGIEPPSFQSSRST